MSSQVNLLCSWNCYNFLLFVSSFLTHWNLFSLLKITRIISLSAASVLGALSWHVSIMISDPEIKLSCDSYWVWWVNHLSSQQGSKAPEAEAGLFLRSLSLGLVLDRVGLGMFSGSMQSCWMNEGPNSSTQCPLGAHAYKDTDSVCHGL